MPRGRFGLMLITGLMLVIMGGCGWEGPDPIFISTDTSPGGESSGGGGESVSISGFNPTSATVGSNISIEGSGFTSGDVVVFAGDNEAVPSSISASSINVTVPEDAYTGPVSIRRSGSIVASSPGSFVVIPTITSFSPDPIPSTTATIVVRGNGFTYDNPSDTSLTIDLGSATQMTATSITVQSGDNTAYFPVSSPLSTGTGFLYVSASSSASNTLPCTVVP